MHSDDPVTRTVEETYSFIDECRYAIDRLFETLRQLREGMEDLTQRAAEIERTENYLSSVFIDRDQWSPHANHHYAVYMQRIANLAKQKQGLATEPERQQRVLEVLARIGATEESMSILASSVLQFGKQVLSYRFGRKPRLPTSRQIGTLSVVEVIWEGRNHALHWEDADTRRPVRQMLESLQAEQRVEVVRGENNALMILAVLEWWGTGAVVDELRHLVSMEDYER